MSHWAAKYIGIPWARGMSGPNSFDCWGFAVTVQRDHYNRILPDIIDRASDSLSAARMIENHEERDKWFETVKPVDGDLVLMARRAVPVHIGVWVLSSGRGAVLHCVEKSGVVYSNLHALRNMSFGNLTYFHPKG